MGGNRREGGEREWSNVWETVTLPRGRSSLIVLTNVTISDLLR